MIITSNLSEVMGELLGQINNELTNDKISRAVAMSMLGMVRQRIHNEGKDADGNKIGVYSPGYMKVRTGKYSTNVKYKKGKNKGEIKETGVYTKGKDKGKQRPNYNRNSDTNVIVSLTGQTENDFSVQPADGGGWGLGYTNELNYAKMRFVENTYKKPIAKLTTAEEDDAVVAAESYTKEVTGG